MPTPRRDFVTLDPYFDDGWDDLRVIRNECAEFMTGDRTEITPEKQLAFRRSFDRTQRSAYVLYDGFIPVGFLYLRWEENVWKPTYGVRASARDKGHGRALVRLSQSIVDHLVLSVRNDNRIALKLYRKMGFCTTGLDAEKTEMEWSA